MQGTETGKAGGLKERALAELKVYWIITLYLWLFLGLFTVYRRLVLAETGSIYLHYGIALVEAMVIAKVVLIGRLFGFSRRFEERALIVPVIYKSVVFGLLVMLFGVIEHLVGGWIRKQGLWGVNAGQDPTLFAGEVAVLPGGRCCRNAAVGRSRL